MWILRDTFGSSFSSSSFLSLSVGRHLSAFVKETFNLSPLLSWSLSADVIFICSGWSKSQSTCRGVHRSTSYVLKISSIYVDMPNQIFWLIKSTSASPNMRQSPRAHWRYWPECLTTASVENPLTRLKPKSIVRLIWAEFDLVSPSWIWTSLFSFLQLLAVFSVSFFPSCQLQSLLPFWLL